MYDSSGESHSVQIDQLTITVTGIYKIEVYKADKHVFSYDCSNSLMCELFTTSEGKPEYVYSDGMVQPSESVLEISVGNIKRFTEGNVNYSANFIAIIVSRTSATGAWGERYYYKINTDTGGVQINNIGWDWMRYGMSKPASD